jgi:hypothetical protein
MCAMSAHLQFQEIPGFADACKREAKIRREAWAHSHTSIAGVRVRLLTLQDMVMLEEMGNGFFNPWRFDTEEEFLGHAAQLVWWLSDCRKPETNSRSLWQPVVAMQREKLLAFLRQRPEELASGVRAYLEDMFLDAPRGTGAGGQAIAAAPAYVADMLSAGGMFMPLPEMMAMPVTRLWQLLRVAARRVYGLPQTNRSDAIACDYLASLNQGKN